MIRTAAKRLYLELELHRLFCLAWLSAIMRTRGTYPMRRYDLIRRLMRCAAVRSGQCLPLSSPVVNFTLTHLPVRWD